MKYWLFWADFWQKVRAFFVPQKKSHRVGIFYRREIIFQSTVLFV
jgi:hypothetical protein